MVNITDYESKDPVAWCPGCGNFGILTALKKALVELDIKPENVLIVSGIGQAAKLPHYLKCNTFNGLHGRALPVAAGARISNHKINVIVVGGDGDGYAEGGNHFIHAMRRNLNMTYIVHNNQIYGLTKGQASPTTDEKVVTKTTPGGVFISPEKPLAIAVANDCNFAARGFSGKEEHLVYLIKEAIQNDGFSFLEILQPCVTFNKTNTYKWYSERVYELDKQDYDPYDRTGAFNKSLEWGSKIPIGIIYKNKHKSYERITGLSDEIPLFQRKLDKNIIEKLYEEFL